MDAERARAYLLSLPYVVETMQWGANLVFWAGDKRLGGKMFTLMDLDLRGGPVISFAAGPERSAELCELEGFRPAPYLARAHWIAADRWDAFSFRQWQDQLAAARELVYERLPPKTKQVLALPKRERDALVAARGKVFAAKAAKAGAIPKAGTDRGRREIL